MSCLLSTRFIPVGLVFKGLEKTLKWGPGESNGDNPGNIICEVQLHSHEIFQHTERSIPIGS